MIFSAAEFVRDQHFGGVNEEEDEARKNMSAKDRFQEIVMKSKGHKLEAKVQKEEQMTKVNKLDSLFSSFNKQMAKHVRNAADDDALKVKISHFLPLILFVCSFACYFIMFLTEYSIEVVAIYLIKFINISEKKENRVTE